MNTMYLVLCVLVAVSSASVVEKRSDPSHAYSAPAPVETPQYYDYSAPQQYYSAPQEPNFLQKIKGSLAALLTLDTAILGLTIAGGLLLLSALRIIDLAPIIGVLQGIFPTITVGSGRASKSSPLARAAEMLLGDEVDRVSEIVHNAIDNIDRWNQ